MNFPPVSLGARRPQGQRIAVAHKNIPGVISGITDALADHGHNVANILSKSRGEYAYALIDIDDQVGDDALEKMSAREGVLRVRFL